MIDYAEAFSRTCKAIPDALYSAPRDIKEMTSHLAGATGKAVRPRLLLACAMGDDGHVPEDAVKLAAAIEIFHMATLVHDDVIDDSPLRRGIPTVQSRFGKKQAVICGDYLLCMAVDMVADMPYEYNADEVRLLPEFLRAAKNICIGEKRQSDNSANLDMGFLEYVKIISGKTAMLFYLSSFAGAAVANRGKIRENMRRIRALASFGRYFGIMFQIMDDCKDYGQSEADALKPVRRDIADGVVTLPLILAMAKEPALKSVAKSAIKGGDIPELIASVQKNGGLEQARSVAEKYRKKAGKYLAEGTQDNEKRARLTEILNGVDPWRR